MRVPHGLTLSDGANPDEIQHLQGRRFARALATAGRLAFSPWKEAWASHATVRALVCDCFLLAERQKDISEPAESGQACRGGAKDVAEPSNDAGSSRKVIGYEQPFLLPVRQNGIGCPTGLRCSGKSTAPSPLMLISVNLESQNPMRKRPSPHSYVVIHGRMPEGCTDWSALSHVGSSVAEVFLEFRPQAEPLPEDFTQWDLPTMDQKSTIAHRAVMLGRPFPANFQAWDLLDPSGKTVITVAREAGNASVIAQYEAWVLAKGIGQPSSASDKPARPVAARIHRRGDI